MEKKTSVKENIGARVESSRRRRLSLSRWPRRPRRRARGVGGKTRVRDFFLVGRVFAAAEPPQPLDSRRGYGDFDRDFASGTLDPDFVAFNSNNRRYHYPARAYAPFRSSWFQTDPLRRALSQRIAASLTGRSPFHFVGARPTISTDPSGLETDCDYFARDLAGYAEIYRNEGNELDRMPEGSMVQTVTTPAVKLSRLVACRYIPDPHNYAWGPLILIPAGYDCAKHGGYRGAAKDQLEASPIIPSEPTGFCTGLTQGGQQSELYRHVAASISSVLANNSVQVDAWVTLVECPEVRATCCCGLGTNTHSRGPHPRSSDSVRTQMDCLQNIAELIGDRIGMSAGTILADFMNGKVAKEDAIAALKALMCAGPDESCSPIYSAKECCW